MKTYIALLRGINVSGKNLIKMAELIEALSVTGISNVRTYIQSGNIVFESGTDVPEILEELISGSIRARFGFQVPVQVLQRDELDLIRGNNPFLEDRLFPVDKLHLTLLNSSPDPDLIKKINPADFLPDEFYISGRAVYLFCPEGYGRTRITNTFFEKRLKVGATTRNWATIKKLCEM